MPVAASAPRQLILTASTGYTWTQLRPFVVSLQRSSFAGDLVMLVGRLSPADRASLRSAGVKLWRIQPLLSRLPVWWRRKFYSRRLGFLHRTYPSFCDRLPLSTARRRLAKAWLGRPFLDIACSRYFFYLSFLTAHAAAYDRVLLTDARDVIFQTDPFAWPLSGDQAFFLEHRTETVASQWGNALWVRNVYGESMLERIGHQRVSCSGVTFGTAAGLLDYLRAMTDELALATPRIAGFPGYDQGIHNRLIWTGAFPRAEVLENHGGPVLTMHGAPTDEFRPDASGRLHDAHDRLVPVLHQYDRHPLLSGPLLAALAPAGTAS